MTGRHGCYRRCSIGVRMMRPSEIAGWVAIGATVLVVGFLTVGYALYLRYLAIEYAQVSLACQAGLSTWLCASFRLAIVCRTSIIL